MGKYSDFERNRRDFYPTPEAAVWPLLPHVEKVDIFVEPCAGDGALIHHLESAGLLCVHASDIEPRGPRILKQDALETVFPTADAIITNPPWDRKLLHPMIETFMCQMPTWLLFDSDWAHTLQSGELIRYCHKIISVGRIKWIPGSNYTGKENCSWYLFDNHPGDTVFIGRHPASERHVGRDNVVRVPPPLRAVHRHPDE